MDVNATALCKPLQVITLLPLLLLISLSANATPVVWTLDGVTFDDGGTASGSFTYDADTNTYSNIAISTTTGSARNAATYNALNPGYLGSGPAELVVVNGGDGPDFLGDPVFFPLFDPPLSNGGGTATIIAFDSAEGSCADAACTSPTPPQRIITGGAVTTDISSPTAAQPVPTLSVYGLLLTTLGLLAVARRRFDGMLNQ